MTSDSEPGTERPDLYAQNARHNALNRSILCLTWVNLCLLLVWYLLYSEYQSSLLSDDAREFSNSYKIFLLAMVAITLAVWGRLLLVVWRLLQLGNTSDNIERR